MGTDMLYQLKGMNKMWVLSCIQPLDM